MLARLIFLRFSDIASRSSSFFSAIAVSPMIAFIGVRISWDIVERKSVFALLAASASLAITLSFLLTECIYRKSITRRRSNPKEMTPVNIQFSVSAFRLLVGVAFSSTQPFVAVKGVWATMHSLPLEFNMVNESVLERISENNRDCASSPGWL